MKKIIMSLLLFASFSSYASQRNEDSSTEDSLFTDPQRKHENTWQYLINNARKDNEFNVFVEAINAIKNGYGDQEIDHIRMDGRDYEIGWDGKTHPLRYFQLRRSITGSDFDHVFSRADRKKLDFFLKIAPKLKIWKSNKGDFLVSFNRYY